MIAHSQIGLNLVIFLVNSFLLALKDNSRFWRKKDQHMIVLDGRIISAFPCGLNVHLAAQRQRQGRRGKTQVYYSLSIPYNILFDSRLVGKVNHQRDSSQFISTIAKVPLAYYVHLGTKFLKKQLISKCKSSFSSQVKFVGKGAIGTFQCFVWKSWHYFQSENFSIQEISYRSRNRSTIRFWAQGKGDFNILRNKTIRASQWPCMRWP